MPPKSRARSGRGEPAESSRKSARISLKTEKKLSQKQAPTEKTRKENTISSVPKPPKGIAREKNNNLTAVPERRNTQASRTKPLKKIKKANDTTVSVREAVIGPRNVSCSLSWLQKTKLKQSSTTQTRIDATLQNPRSVPAFTNPSERLEIASETIKFYHSRGYEAPEEASMTSTVKSSRVSNQKLKKPEGYGVSYESPKFTTTLKEHKISNVAKKDPQIAFYKSLVFDNDLNATSIRNSLDREIQRREEALWDTDMSKCARSNEARFQRTIMMTIINRQELDENLEFICEAPWISERFPCKDCIAKLCKLPQAKPDVAVAFQAETLLPSDGFHADWERLKDFEPHIFPEGNQEYQDERAFHFFSMEVKGKRGSLDNQKAQFQNLNTGSQALYNIYYCMERTDDLDTFFNEVRVFSAVATTEGLSIRIHWPIKLKEGQYVNRRYPIGFQFDELGRLRGDYSRAQATSVVYNILYKYGVQTLHPILKKTIVELLKLYPCKASAPSLRDLQQAAATQETLEEIDSPPASQNSRGRKRPAQTLGDSFTSTSRRKLDDVNINDPQESEVGVEE